MSSRKTVRMTVNEESTEVVVEPRKLLVDVIREDLGLTGTHVGCEHGVCGACTVLMDGSAVRSCLMFGMQAEGRDITTIEGLAGAPDEMTVVQKAFWSEHGLQCGFCTPGMVLTATELLRENPTPTRDEIREAIAGNMCRCTGYVFIVAAIERAADELARERAARDA